MFSFFKRLKQATVESTAPITIKSTWRNNMWVMSPKGIGVLFSYAEPAEVHLVNEDGSTKEVFNTTLAQLRQAFYMEIPESRRGSPEKAALLGYM